MGEIEGEEVFSLADVGHRIVIGGDGGVAPRVGRGDGGVGVADGVEDVVERFGDGFELAEVNRVVVVRGVGVGLETSNEGGKGGAGSVGPSDGREFGLEFGVGGNGKVFELALVDGGEVIGGNAGAGIEDTTIGPP